MKDLILPEGALPVLWDINNCPLTDAYDARRLGQWIEEFLKNLGHTGPIAITAVGRLARVPYKVLRAASSSGITLYDAPYGKKREGLHVILPFPSDCGKADAKIFLQNALHTDPDDEDAMWECGEALWDAKDGKYSETAIWVCGVCYNLTGRGIENYTKHVNGGKHAQLLFLNQQQKMGFPNNMSKDDVKRLKSS